MLWWADMSLGSISRNFKGLDWNIFIRKIILGKTIYFFFHWQMTPRCLLVGHTAPVLCLAHASIIADNAFFVSSSENG